MPAPGIFLVLDAGDPVLENPALAKSMSYHDGVNFAERVTCETYVCTGFGIVVVDMSEAIISKNTLSVT